MLTGSASIRPSTYLAIVSNRSSRQVAAVGGQTTQAQAVPVVMADGVRAVAAAALELLAVLADVVVMAS